MTFRMAKELFEGVTVVSDREALDAQRFILERLKVMTEPAASCTLAAADKLHMKFAQDQHVVLVFCGGNMSVEDLVRLNAV
jgi:threonine dehydratase